MNEFDKRLTETLETRLNSQSERVQWLVAHVEQNVKLQCGAMTYEGQLRYFAGIWEVRFIEFTPNEISSYGHDLEGCPYVILTGE